MATLMQGGLTQAQQLLQRYYDPRAVAEAQQTREARALLAQQTPGRYLTVIGKGWNRADHRRIAAFFEACGRKPPHAIDTRVTYCTHQMRGKRYGGCA